MSIWAEKAWLGDDWASCVRISYEDRIEGIETGVEPASGDERVTVLSPGFVNAHSHAFQRALVGRTERRGGGDDDFWSWREPMYALAARLDADRVRVIATQLFSEMVAAGYTSVVEFHYLLGGKASTDNAEAMLGALTSAAEQSGIRLVYAPVFYERAGFDRTDLEPRQRRFSLTLERFLAHFGAARDALAAPHSVAIGAHSLRAVSLESLDALVDAARANDAPFHIHVAEQPREVADCLRQHGRRPVELLLDRYDPDGRWTLVHATHLDDAETERLAASGAVACLCPSTEGNLGDGLFPLPNYLRRGGRFSIGSDSHVTVDPFEELRWLDYGQRLAAGARGVTAAAGEHSGTTLLRQALAGGRQSAGQGECGLVAGAPADFLCLDDSHPVLAGHGDTTRLDALVFGGGARAIDKVIVAGRVRVDGGRHRRAEIHAAEYRACVDALYDAASVAEGPAS